MKKVIVTGNVGRDPEMRADQNGNSFATFSLAVSVGTKQSPKTDWVDISCNDKLADIARSYIKKGSKLLIEGFPSVSAYLNNENKAVGTLRVTAQNIEFIGGGQADDSASTHQEHNTNSQDYTLPTSSSSDDAITLKSDEIPF
jgi:single-strand DNA-binding protein